MKYSLFTKKSQGIGLIEILVTSVVVGIGLLGVARLQGDLIGDSRNNKTRAECQILANTKIEQLRDTIEKTGTTGYIDLASSTSNESITGVTETFSRNWVVTDVPDHTNPIRKQVSVTVSWGTGTENSCKVQSIITFDSIVNSEMAAEGSGQSGAGSSIGGSSLNAKSSDEITKTITLASVQAVGNVVTVNGKTYIVNANLDGGGTNNKASGASLCSLYTPFENDLFTHRVDNDGVSGNEAIELYEKVVVGSVEYCIPRIRYNGGVIIPIRGIVHSGATAGTGQNQSLLDVNLFTFNASESGTFCVFKPAANAKSAPYVCYVGGNCQGFTGTPLADSVTECQNDLSAAVVGFGGWRGKVGLLGVASNGRNVCFAEELASVPETLDTARNYYTRKAGLNEGINKPYSCHDFLIINGKTTEAKIHGECVTQANAIGGFKLATKTIQRDITGDNIFDPVIDTSFCVGTTGTVTITGAIANAVSAPVVTVTYLSTTKTCLATATFYNCQIPTSVTSVTISGIYNSQTVNVACTLPASPTSCNLTFPTTNPTYTINGIITGTSLAANAVSLSLSDGGTCAYPYTNNNNGTYSYSCSITTALSSATLTATIATGGTITPNTPQTITLSGSPLTGPALTATMASTHIISGTIAIGNNVVVTTVTVAVDTGAGNCTLTGTHAQNTNDSYSCTVPSGINNLNIAISPACSTGGGSKKYQLSDGTTTSLTGSLVIPFSNITGDITKNFSITRLSTNC